MNPSLLGQGTKLSGENFVNDPKPTSHIGYNKFNRSYPHITTARYGDMTPFYVENSVENDNIPLASHHDVRTPTMVSPFLGDIVMKKAYFDVPLRSIYPLNYDLMRVPPTFGDDIPRQNAAYIPGGFFFALQNSLRSASPSSTSQFVQILIFLEKFFSRASLFDYLGCHLSNIFSAISTSSTSFKNNFYSFDLFFEHIATTFFSGTTAFPDDADEWCLFLIQKSTGKRFAPIAADSPNWDSFPSGTNFVSVHYMLELLRDNPFDFNILIRDTSGREISETDAFNALVADIKSIKLNFDTNTDINIERLVAYQLAMIEYSTDDHIDSIYTTDLYRQLMSTYQYDFLDSLGRVSEYLFFSRNGVQLKYDVFSSIIWQLMIDCMATEYTIYDLLPMDCMLYIWNLLSIRKSLRFEDYFVGGRLNPLAIGDVDVPVIDGNVNAFEMARGMVYTRYFNAVNLSGSNFDEYSKEILKNTPPPRNDVPKFLAMTVSRVGGYEVENTTSENQGALVTNIRSSDERFAFSVNLDHESILLGVCFFEVRRMYSKTVDRHFFHVDREDRFVPKLQYVGDQDISLAELRAGSPLDTPFAYGVRNGEYKQRVGVVSGGVVDFLKSWVMVTDTQDSYDDDDNLNSDYIRSKNVEFDRFFQSTNNSLAGYFHFILMFNNISEPVRPMDVAPEILK